MTQTQHETQHMTQTQHETQHGSQTQRTLCAGLLQAVALHA